MHSLGHIASTHSVRWLIEGTIPHEYGNTSMWGLFPSTVKFKDSIHIVLDVFYKTGCLSAS